ncbi:MAG TPA: arsenic transporter [Tepidisphaeraceae bacterium]|nr:arsenic transporter [Tepidisphaeraceae bacterium]
MALVSIFLMLVRPRGTSELAWIGSGALLLVFTRLIPFEAAWHAVREGIDVYLFLAGMMLLAELARREGVFEWLADLATRHANGSASRLFLLIYAVGTVVTVFLSNDATAVVLTPAVLAAVRRTKANPLPHLFACAFIANAASFVLPISNPANLVVFAKDMPPLAAWLRIFALPSLLSIGITLAALYWTSRNALQDRLQGEAAQVELSRSGKLAGCGLLLAAAALIAASALHADLGLPTLIAALIAVGIVMVADRAAFLGIVRKVSWSVLPLVAGLFVVVEAVNRAGALRITQQALDQTARLVPIWGRVVSAFGVGLISNLMNNLPVGLASGAALRHDGMMGSIAHAVLIGVDLGPNLSVTGSLATILWLIALRREGINVSAWQFLKMGIVVMPLALLAAAIAAGS